MMRRSTGEFDRLAKVVAACGALETFATRYTWFDGDSIANFESARLVSYPYYNTCTLMAEHIWAGHFQSADPTVLPKMYVRATIGSVFVNYRPSQMCIVEPYPQIPLQRTWTTQSPGPGFNAGDSAMKISCFSLV
jgi:hypothetical protein